MANRNKQPEDIEQLIHEALEQLGWGVDAGRVAARIWRLNVGLPREDEFSVVCSWLGHCDLIHKLDQKQTPESSGAEFQVPDLLAVFNVDGKRVPVLIEVKSKKDKVLSFRPDYLERLKNYAQVLNLPILVAWKWQGLWMLFEIKHFQKARKNFNIHFQDAIKENLLGVLAGDFSYALYEGAGLYIVIKKEKLIGTEQNDEGYTEQWQMMIEDVYFTDGNRKVVRNLPSPVQQLFVTWELEESEEHTDTHIIMKHVAPEGPMLFAHMALVRLLNWQMQPDEKIHWRAMLHGANIVKGVDDFREAVQEAMDNKIVRIVLNQKPQTEPSFELGT